MLKQKSGLGFKPKAPQARRNVQASPQLPERPSTTERQSKTPAPHSTPSVEPGRLSSSAAAPKPTTEPNPVAFSTDGVVAPMPDNRHAEAAPVAQRARTGQTTSTEESRTRVASTSTTQNTSRQPEPVPAEATISPILIKPSPSAPARETPIAPPAIPTAPKRSPPPRISTTPIPLPAVIQGKAFQSTQAPARTLPPLAPSKVLASPKLDEPVTTTTVDVPPRNRPRPSIEAAESSETVPLRKPSRQARRAKIVVEIPGKPPKVQSRSVGKKPAQTKTARRRRTVRATASDDSYEGQSVEDNEEGRRQANGDTAAADAEYQQREEEQEAESSEAEQPKKRRKRSVTPEDAENIELDPRQVKMADLAKDLKIGKKFEKHDQIKQREKQRRAQVRLARKLRLQGLERLVPNPDGSQASAPGTPAAAVAGVAGADNALAAPAPRVPNPAPTGMAGPQFEVIDGQIVVNQQSLQVDRHALAAAEAGDMAQVEEDDFSRRVTSGSYRRKPLGPNHWSFTETERFYRALRMFGTNFQMISEMFPTKDRRQVKLKFNREERFCPRRVNAALIGEQRTEIDLDEFREYATGMQLESVEAIETELRLREEEHEATERRKEEEATEIAAQKRAQLYAGRAAEHDASQGEGAEGDGGGKAKTRRKRGPRKKTAEVDTGFGI